LSLFHYVLTNELTELRLRLDLDPAAERFPVLMDLKAKGFTDYLGLLRRRGSLLYERASLGPPAPKSGSPRSKRRSG
jgi:hypothetical protein